MSGVVRTKVVDLRGPLIRLRPFRQDEADEAWAGLSLQDELAHPRRRPEDRRATPSDRFRRSIERSAGTATGNAAMRAVLDRLGFRLEGVLRAYGPAGDGTRSDGALYAVIRSDRTDGRGARSR